MTLNQAKIAAIVAAAKTAAANSPRWIRAIERAAAALANGELIVTLCGSKSLVTSANGSYWVNGACQCKAAKAGHAECYHRAAARLVEMYEAEIYAPKPEPPKRQPTITRSIERDYNGVKVVAVRCNGWLI